MLKHHQQQYTPTPEDQIINWYAEGLPFSTIATRLNIATECVVETIQNFIEQQLTRIHGDRSILIVHELTQIDRLQQEAWIAWQRSVEWQTQTDTEKVVTPLMNESDSAVNSEYENESQQQSDTNEQNEPNNNTNDNNTNNPNDWSNWARIERTNNNSLIQTNKRNRRIPQFHPVYPIAIDTNDDDDKKAADTPKLTTTRKVTVTPGDKKFMDVILACIDRRINLLGLNAPTRTQNNTLSIQMTEEMTRQYITELALHHGVNPEDIVDSVFTDVQTLKQLPSTSPHNNPANVSQ